MKTENSTRSGRIATAVLGFAAMLLVFGCTNADPTPGPGKPLCLGIAYDVSQSVSDAEMPAMTTAQLEQVLDLLKKRGGVMAFGAVDENAFEPLMRAQVVPVKGRLDERARRNQKNVRGLSAFASAVSDKLNRSRNARRTDINGSIRRFMLFFNEPNHMPSSEKVLIFISDGKDTGAWRNSKGIRLADDVSVFSVGVEASLASKLFGSRVTLFESIDAAIRNIDDSSQ
ncbi:MAG: hypothetical protein DKINENOH_04529 [bacterium]|nr:hypothetical protein [bacterium]